MRIKKSDLNKLAISNPALRLGCVADTNALFAVSVDLDRLTDWAVAVFSDLETIGIPVFTNLNIRSEFLELHRRVLIPEGLISYYDKTNKDTLSMTLKTQLRNLKIHKDQAAKDLRLFKFNEQQIKKYRYFFEVLDQTRGWEKFCADFFHPYVSNVWEKMIDELKVQFVGTRAIESREYFHSDPNWKDMTDIIGRFGIGSADAMIVNFFLCSKFPVIITGDEDVAYAVERLSNGTKYVVVPDNGEEKF